MKLTLTTNEAVRLLMQDENANWSREGATALVEILDEIDPDMEFDAVAIRCEYHEYKTAAEAVYDMFGDELEEDDAYNVLDRECVLVYSFDGGVIVRHE